jgi:hypothetical protein
MHPLLLHGFGTSLRVNGRTLEIDWRSKGRKESYRPQQLPFDSVVVDSMTGSVSFGALRFLGTDGPTTGPRSKVEDCRPWEGGKPNQRRASPRP